MTSRKRTKLAITGLVATPVTGLILGVIAWAVANHVPNADGVDLSKILPLTGFVLGFLGAILGIVLGLATTVITRNLKKNKYILPAYLLPCGIAIIYMVYLIIVNS